MYRNPYNPYSRSSPSGGSLLCTLPTEISEQIYLSLPYGDLTRLARVNRALYTSVQSPLYRHAKVTSYERLTLFIRTLHHVARFDKSGGGAVSKHVVTLRLTIDPNASESGSLNHNRPTAVMLSRMIGALGGYCPSVSITLHISNGSCDAQPLTSFELETFPRVSTLILEVGVPSISSGSASVPPARPSFHQVIPSRRTALQSWGRSGSGCNPNPKFWSGIFNGSSFPDLREVEVLHDPGSPASQWAKIVEFGEGDLKGLGKVTRLVVNSAPELNDSVLMGALTRAECLKRLELRNIVGLSYEALSVLLPLALPNLTHFTLHIPPRHRSARQARDQLESYQPLAPTGEENPSPVHLCPLLRVYGRNLQYLEVFAPYLCRDLFLHESEKSKLDEEGVRTDDIGGVGGGVRISHNGDPFFIDRIALEQTVRRVRKQNGERSFREAVQSSLREQLSVNKTKDITSAGAISTAEYEEEQKGLKRVRTIKEQGWRRLMRFREGMCREGESWEEIGVLASLEEENVKWTCINDAVKSMATYVNGIGAVVQVPADPPIPADPSRAFGRTNTRPFMSGHDYNDDLAGGEDGDPVGGADGDYI